MMVSVCMAVFNGEKYIRDQIDSILSQLTLKDELIISDDGSIDRTIEIIEAYNDNRIKIYKNNFKNLISNFEFVLTKASGDYIFLSDQDDIWMSEKVKKVVSYLQTYDLVVHDNFVTDSTGEVVENSFFRYMMSGPGFIKNLVRNTYLGCCMAFNKELLKIILPFPKRIPMHDIWIGAIAELHGNPIFINDRLLKYRRHPDTASITYKKSTFNLFKKIKFRIVILIDVLIRTNEIKFRNLK